MGRNLEKNKSFKYHVLKSVQGNLRRKTSTVSMARKGRKRIRSTKAISREIFPLGELAKRRKVLRDTYIEKCKFYSTKRENLKA